jgi:molybdenum-dependent DNA-binding transcriptional regulator ModE
VDLKVYYQKIRDLETKIESQFPVIISNETADGGKNGAATEVTRPIAAKMIADGFARLANEKETELFQAAKQEAVRLAEQLAQAAKVQLAVLTSNELDRLKNAANQSRK